LRFTPTSQFGVLPRSVEVDQREPSAFVRIFGNLGEVTSFTIRLRFGSDGFGFKLIRECDQPSLYFDVTGHERKLAALLDFIA
jgi:hypothetical protein